MNKLRIENSVFFRWRKCMRLWLVISLLISIPYGFIIIVFGAALIGTGDRGGMAAGGGSIVNRYSRDDILPIVYSSIGFIGGAIGALIYKFSPEWSAESN